MRSVQTNTTIGQSNPIARDIQNVVSDAQELLKTVQAEGESRLADVKSKMQVKLDSAKQMLGELQTNVQDAGKVAIDQTDGADTGGSEIESGRRAEPPGTDEQDLRLVQLYLALATYVAENNLTAVSLNLLFSEFHLEDVPR